MHDSTAPDNARTVLLLMLNPGKVGSPWPADLKSLGGITFSQSLLDETVRVRGPSQSCQARLMFGM